MPPASVALLEQTIRQAGRRSWQEEFLADYQPVRFSGPFGGFTSHQTTDTIPQAPNRRGLTKSPDLLNMYSRPFGAITSFPGHVNINAVAANSSKAITGVSWMGQISSRLLVAAQNQVGFDDAGTWTQLTGSPTITDDDDNFMDVAYLNDVAVLAFLKKDAPLQVASPFTATTTLGGSPRSGVKGCFSWDGRMWLVSDQNIDYSAINNVASYDLTDDTLNFLQTTGAGTSDGTIISAWVVAGDAVYVGKAGPNSTLGHLFRISRTGNPASPYQIERIETGGVGPSGSKAAIMAGQDLVFLANDGNVHLVRGNLYVPNGIGRSIQRTLVADYSMSRMEFASMGLLREHGYLGLSLSLSGATTNARAWWYDYLNSQPGNEEKEFWHHTDHAINAWGERISSGQRQLVAGNYAGRYARHLSGDSYAGSAYTKRWVGPWHLLGDPYQWYEVLGIAVAFEPTGNFNVTFSYAKDFDQAFTTVGTFNVKGGAELGSFVLGTDTLGGDEHGVAWLEIGDVMQRIKPRFTNANADEPFNILNYALLVRPVYRGLDI